MELEITSIIHIDIDAILEDLHKSIFEISANDDTLIKDYVDNYVGSLDDCEYYLIGDDEKNKIVEEIKRRLH